MSLSGRHRTLEFFASVVQKCCPRERTLRTHQTHHAGASDENTSTSAGEASHDAICSPSSPSIQIVQGYIDHGASGARHNTSGPDGAESNFGEIGSACTWSGPRARCNVACGPPPATFCQGLPILGKCPHLLHDCCACMLHIVFVVWNSSLRCRRSGPFRGVFGEGSLRQRKICSPSSPARHIIPECMAWLHAGSACIGLGWPQCGAVSTTAGPNRLNSERRGDLDRIRIGHPSLQGSCDPMRAGFTHNMRRCPSCLVLGKTKLEAD